MRICVYSANSKYKYYSFLKKYILSILYITFLLNNTLSYSQEKYISRNNVSVIFSKPEPIYFKIKDIEKGKDSVILNQFANQILESLAEQGYLSVQIDSISETLHNGTIYISAGNQFHWINLNSDSIEPYVLRAIKLKPTDFKNRVINLTKLNHLKQKLVEYYENTGFPFAISKLTNVKISGDSISASIIVLKNQLVVFDSILVKGNMKLSNSYLYNYLELKKNKVYCESDISKTDELLNNLSFVKTIKPSFVEFFENKYNLILYIENKKANRFDGVIGFMPNKNNNEKLSLSGDVTLNLNNAIGKGETLDLEWKKPAEYSQELSIDLEYPFIFNLPLGLGFDFNLEKKDTSYIKTSARLGVNYYYSNANFFKFFIDNRSSTITTKQKNLSNLSITSAAAGYESFLYGIEFLSDYTDYKANPRKGFIINASCGYGNKKYKVSSTDSIKNKANFQLEIKSKASVYFSTTQNTVLSLGSKIGFLSNKDLFINELFKIGGLKTLRGFDENVLNVSFYSITTIEYKLIFEKNSNLFTFVDMAYTEQNIQNQFKSGFPIGFGAGINFETKAGIFSVTYALGKQGKNEVDLKTAKIHFGYINTF